MEAKAPFRLLGDLYRSNEKTLSVSEMMRRTLLLGPIEANGS
jgi:hypothetical protein